jgi:hypothetical protein
MRRGEEGLVVDRVEEPARGASGADVWARLRERVGLRRSVDACAPVVAFVVGFAVAGLGVGLVAAVAVALVLSGVRVLRREGVRPALVSLIVVALAALLAHRSGRGVEFFLPDLVMNSALALWFAMSLALRRPATGTVLRMLGLPDAAGYRRGQMRATTVWLVLWVVHLVLEVPLYLGNHVLALGVLRIVLGPPMWIPVGWLGWRLHQRALASDRRRRRRRRLSVPAGRAPSV